MNTKKVIGISLVVAVLVCFGFLKFTDAGSALGASISNVQSVLWQFKAGISLDSASNGADGGSVILARSGTIAAGQNQGYWTNKTGRTVFVDYGDVALNGVASSSVRVSVATSTLTALTNNFAAPYGSLIDNQLIATSTPQVAAVVNSDVGSGTNSKGTIEVPDGTSVIFLIRQDDSRACTGATCETATSTNRGWTTANWFMEAHYRP